MLGRGVGLADLVERWRCPCSEDDFDSIVEARSRGEVSQSFLIPSALAEADAVCRYARAGLFDYARRFRGLGRDEREYLDTIETSWWGFRDVIRLCDQIDNFLATLEGDRRATGLARACRDDLDLLLILADCCEEHDLPRAAEQARYYHGLAESKWRE